MQIIFAGSGEFGIPTLRALLEAGHTVVQVITQPDRPAGRGRVLTPTPIATFALDVGLSVIRTEDINTLTLPEADLMIVIAFGQKISPHIVDHARLGSVNLHASRLPRWRGAAPINWAILAGDATTGNSVIRLAEKMDAGAVLGMTETPIGDAETAGELHDRLAINGAPLMLRVVEQLQTGKAVEVEQHHSEATLARKLSRETSVLDFTRPPVEIARKICGLWPWPGCRVQLIDPAGKSLARLHLVRAKVSNLSPVPTMLTPGTITPVQTVRCGDGHDVEIIEVQPEGKKPMPLAAYVRGNRWDAGTTLQAV